MNKFNDAYERLYEYWSYGGAIDYNVEEQLDDWVTIHREYTRISKALGKAVELLDANVLCENCPFPHGTKRCTVEGRREYLRECLLEGNYDGCRKTV